MLDRWISRLALAIAATLLAACGGGGGGGGGGPNPPSTSVTVSGLAEFESVPNGASGALVYASAAYRPIRGATVELISDAGATLASGTTNASGRYSLTTNTPSASMFVRVRAETRRDGPAGGSWNISVRDNTASEALYVLDSPRFDFAQASRTVDLRAGSGWGGASYTATRSAAPFALLDAAWQSVQAVLAASADQALPPLSIMWSPNNRPVGGTTDAELASGQIGTTFFFYDGTRRRIFVLGAQDVDTDEYDSHVIAHEWGHFLQSALSRDDSVGGTHGDGDRLDRSVAFSEGFGNAWSGIALGQPAYADSLGLRQSGGFAFSVATNPAVGGQGGWWSEDSVQYLLWQYAQTSSIGFAPMLNVLSGASLRQSSIPVSIHQFSFLLRGSRPAAAATIDGLLASQSITVQDGLGTGEVNSGGYPSVLPMYRVYTGGILFVCVSDAAGRPNKADNYTYVRFTTTAVSRRISVVEANGVPGTDPDFILTRADGSQRAALSTLAGNETIDDTLPAGTHTLMLSDFSMTDSSVAVGQRCFNVTIQ